MKTDFYKEVSRNKWMTYVMIVIFLLFISLLGWVFGALLDIGFFGLVIAAIIAVVFALVQYYHGDKMVLTISKARPATKKEFPTFVNAVEGLAIAAGIPKPSMYVIDDTSMNAFATGRDPEHASVCATTGIIKKLDRTELEGVIAHEMSHVKNFDIRLMTIVVVLVGVAVLISDWMLRSIWFGAGRRRKSKGGGALLLVAIVLAVLTPFIAMLVKLSISRKREYLADASAAKLTRYPDGLADALEKLMHDREPLEAANKATAHLYIVNPLRNLKGVMNGLFSTHPPLEERIRKLRAM